jgi:hypothetical protein
MNNYYYYIFYITGLEPTDIVGLILTVLPYHQIVLRFKKMQERCLF